MSHFATYVVGSAVSALFFAALGRITDPAPYMVVNELTYRGGFVYQDREVFADQALTARWQAYVLDKGEPVCAGSGGWPYPSGHKVAEIPLDEWVGQDGCLASLQPSRTYQLQAVYSWGEGSSTTQTSLGFRK